MALFVHSSSAKTVLAGICFKYLIRLATLPALKAANSLVYGTRGEPMVTSMEKPLPKINPFENAQKMLDDAAKLINLDPAIHEFLRWPQRELHVSFPALMDDGSWRIFKG